MDPTSSEPSPSIFLQPVLNVPNDRFDVSLRGADDQSKPIQWIPCHRAILVAKSTYFRSMFASQMKDSHEEQIQLQDIPHEILDQIVRYIYTEEIALTTNNVLLLLESALFFDVTEIITACKEFLEKNMDTENWLATQRTAKSLSCRDIVEISEKFVVNNFSVVSRCDDFLKISESQMIKLIASDDLFAKSEDEVADAVMRWFNTDRTKRILGVGEILPLIRVPFLSAERAKTVRSMHMDQEKIPVDQSQKVMDGIIRQTPYQHRDSYKPILVAVGGDHRPKCVHRFDPVTKAWIPVRLLPPSQKKQPGNLPIIVTPSGSVLIYELIYDDAIARSCMWRYDSDTDQWERWTPLPVGRCEGPLVASEKVYVLVSGDQSQCFVCYNDTSKEWDHCGTFPGKVLLSSAMTVDDNGCIYKLGGHDHSYKVDKKGRLSDAAYCFDPRDKTIKTLAKMPSKRYKSCVAVGPDGLIYVIGGIRSEHMRKFKEFFVDCCDVYNPRTNQWQTKYAKRWAVSSDSTRLLTFDGKLHLFSHTMVYYDAVQDSWTHFADRPPLLGEYCGYGLVPQHVVRKWMQQPGSCVNLDVHSCVAHARLKRTGVPSNVPEAAQKVTDSI
ncbi:kelch-like protein diablo isoform X2 [Paramacrobiotus metropolitanus]|uniref:kelch-like protein diablo isoform X2 n=1 Tax=Paramacrobiotus metropolitanus TaxID=2943436 RepID=UPI002445864E|nr:kelch-like protein diablo isoform X2 [Paramacrobiotus metropolitanus]